MAGGAEGCAIADMAAPRSRFWKLARALVQDWLTVSWNWAAVFDQIAERLAVRPITDFVRGETQEGGGLRTRRRPGPPSVGDQNPVHAAGVGPQGRTDAEGVQHAEGREGDGRGPPVKGRRQLGVERLRIDQNDPQPALRCGKRKCRSGEAGTGDNDVIAVGLAHGEVYLISTSFLDSIHFTSLPDNC